MKRIFVAVLAIGLLCVGYAESARNVLPKGSRSLNWPEEMVYESAPNLSNTYTIRNSSSSDLETNVETTIIIPGIHKIIGYQVIPILNSNVGAWAALYDGESGIQSHMIGESETIANASDGEIFPYPKAVRTGGLMVQQSCYSAVVIHYVR